jgi:hypothetical protein
MFGQPCLLFRNPGLLRSALPGVDALDRPRLSHWRAFRGERAVGVGQPRAEQAVAALRPEIFRGRQQDLVDFVGGEIRLPIVPASRNAKLRLSLWARGQGIRHRSASG